MPSSGAEHWESLAEEEDRKAAWDDVHVGSGAASRNKAAVYRRAADAARLQETTGEPHCVCCLKPLGCSLDYWRR